MNKRRLLKEIDLEEIKSIVKTSFSYFEVLKVLGCNPGGYNMKKLRVLCKNNSISIDHFKSRSKEEEYNRNPKYCKNCGKILSFEQRRNSFCSKSCSTEWNNKNRRKYKKKKRDRNLVDKEQRSSRDHNLRLKKKYPGLNFIEKGCCPICGEYNCNNIFCKNHRFNQLISMKDYGFNIETIGTTLVFLEFDRIKNLFYEKYWIEKKSIIEISEEYKKSQSSTYSFFDHLGIPRRSFSESGKNAVYRGRINIPDNHEFKSGTHISWEGNSYYLRSSYERIFAQFLDKEKISYQVESVKLEYFDTFQNKSRIAIPDFYLPETNELIEIKSDFTLNIQEMMDKFSAYKEKGFIPKLFLEQEEVDLYNLEKYISKERLEKIKKYNFR